MKIVTTYLDHLAIDYNKETVDSFFSTHPYHPSLLSISDLFDHFNIENAGVAIGKDNFTKVPAPFIAKTASSEGDYCLVTQLDDQSVTYLNEKDRIVTTSLELFFMQYSGVVLVGQKTRYSGEPDFVRTKAKIRQQRLLQAISLELLLAVFSFWFLSSPVSFSGGMLFLLKVAGLAVTSLLLIQSFNMNNPFINRLCSSASGNGCQDILGSEGAKIFKGRLSWSEIGFFYFLATWLTLSIGGSTSSTLLTLAVFNVCALPYTFYSIIYQYRKKTWCKLCLSVQVILWLEFFATLPVLLQVGSIRVLENNPAPYVLLAILLVIGSLWVILKPLIQSAQQIKKLQRDINQFKKDDNIFYTLLEQQRKIEEMAESDKIIFGNPEASFEITFVSNPFCKPCSEMHKLLSPLVDECRSKLKFTAIYTASYNSNDPKNEIIQKLIGISQQLGSRECEMAMADWYESGVNNPKAWLEKYTDVKIDESVMGTFEAHRAWCDENEITHTPALFFNNHLYLSEYTLADIKHFINISQVKEHGRI